MKSVILVIVFMFSTSADAVDLVCSLPAENVDRSVELCEELRLSLHVRTTDWNNDVCASQFLRIGLIEGERRSTRRSFNRTLSTAIGEAVESFKSTWPKATAAICGDGTLDTEFGESCDDGNVVNGDGCSASCVTE